MAFPGFYAAARADATYAPALEAYSRQLEAGQQALNSAVDPAAELLAVSAGMVRDVHDPGTLTARLTALQVLAWRNNLHLASSSTP